MRALQGILVVVTAVAACKGSSSPSATGSAAPPPTPVGSAAGSATGSAVAAAPTPDPAPTPTQAAKPYESPTFTVTSSLTGPEIKQKDIDTEAGKTTMTMYEFSDPHDDNVMQMVESNPIAKVSKSATQKVLESSMEGMTENVHATVDDKKMVDVGTDTMLDFTAHWTDEDGQFYMRGRVAARPGTMYQVVAMGKGPTPTPAAEGFVTSFRLK